MLMCLLWSWVCKAGLYRGTWKESQSTLHCDQAKLLSWERNYIYITSRKCTWKSRWFCTARSNCSKKWRWISEEDNKLKRWMCLTLLFCTLPHYPPGVTHFSSFVSVVVALLFRLSVCLAFMWLIIFYTKLWCEDIILTWIHVVTSELHMYILYAPLIPSEYTIKKKEQYRRQWRI